jgi:hypothetical protein
MAEYYVVHNGPQGSGNGSSIANGMDIQTAMDTAVAGDRVRVCATGTYAMADTINVNINSGTIADPIVVTGASSDGTIDGTRAEFTMSTTNHLFTFGGGVNYHTFQYLNFIWNSPNTRNMFYFFPSIKDIIDCTMICLGTGGGFFIGTGAVGLLLRCNHVGGSYGFGGALGGVVDCVATGCSGAGFQTGATGSAIRIAQAFVGCVAYDCGIGFSANVTSQGGQAFINCLAFGNTTGIAVPFDTQLVQIDSCTIADNVNGIDIVGTGYNGVFINNSIISHNSGYGIKNNTMPKIMQSAFHSNTSGNLALGSLDATNSTAIDPSFVDRINATLASRNYALGKESGLWRMEQTDLFGNTFHPARGAFQGGPTPAQIAEAVWGRTGRTLT